MTLKNTDDRWGAVSQLFHWVIVVLILVMAYIGLTMGDLPNGPRKINIYALHKSIGLTILALVVLRVLWRMYAGTPSPVAGTPTWQQRVASVTHFLLYALLFAIPLLLSHAVVSSMLIGTVAVRPFTEASKAIVPAVVVSNGALPMAALLGFSKAVDAFNELIGKVITETGIPDKRVRQALSLAIDRAGIAHALMGDEALAATQLLPPALAAWHRPDVEPR